MKINTIHGEMDEALLQKIEGGLDNETEATTWVEYCLKDCDGQAHTSGQPDADHCFCSKHVHRSVDMKLKKNVVGLGSVASFS